MGLGDRDYMQEDEGFSARGAWAAAGVSHKLIVLNVIVWVFSWFPDLQGFLGANFTVSWTGLFQEYRVWTILTYAFGHAGGWHLFWNMLFLHWFGPPLEEIYGKRNFLVFYLYAAVVGGLAHCGWAHVMGGGAVLGASGAVMACVLVTAIFYPQRTILLFFVMPIPLWLLASIKILGDLMGIVGGPSGVSNAAHLGGAAAGALFWHFDLRVFAGPRGRRARGGLFSSLLKRWRAKQVGLTVHEGGKTQRVTAEVAARVDDLLRKIHAQGMDSLTDEERAFLEGASGHYRRS